MNNSDILKIAMKQSAIDSSCDEKDFENEINKVVVSKCNPNARKYLELPFYCDLTSYGNNIVASVSEELIHSVKEYIDKYTAVHCFETPNLLVLQEYLLPFNLNICFMAEYFLPDITVLTPLQCDYELRFISKHQLEKYYLPEWSNALCSIRKELDVFAIGAFEKEKLIGLAGCSADCETMWQIGIDVLPAYRKKGIASALTSALACEILNYGKVPFYCSAWSNISSVRNAIKCGFRPAWVQVTAKKNSFIENINNKISFFK